jgi:hypothetical protein
VFDSCHLLALTCRLNEKDDDCQGIGDDFDADEYQYYGRGRRGRQPKKLV